MMRIAGVGSAVLLASRLASAEAQQPGQPLSVDAGRIGIPPPLVIPSVLLPLTPENTRLGILTLLPPNVAKGEIVRIGVPIGELTGRLARKVSSARRQRRARKAREAVERDLQHFLAQQAAK